MESACRDDIAFLTAVNDVLAGAEAGVLDSPAVEFAAPLLADLPADLDAAPALAPPATPASSTIGPYRIVREIGHGGMGTVFLAERADRQFEKRVALKLLRGWSAGDERMVRRFLDERQILAALDHPSIARLLDGGVTTDALPWFAMEYAEGVPIDRYCDERRLSVEARLELFCRVCAPVQYAHRHLVVHRDLKPANILITFEGEVKLLDFGIAKLLSGETGASATLTMPGERFLTPLYSSPEQLRGEPVSTATDVYALGVLLHHLLTGRFPYRVTTRESYEVARAILEQEPERPSVAVLRAEAEGDRGGSASSVEQAASARGTSPVRLARRLRGDLDTIVLTAIQKDPAQRYGTAEQLEADVRRYLAGLPLTARAESRLSRARKFVRRHRVGVAITAGVALLVIGFAVVTGVQSVRISRQAARIEVERDRAQQVSSYLASLFRTSDPYAGAGAGLTARQILDSGAARIDRELAAQPDLRAEMMLEMGRAYFGLGLRDRARRFAEISFGIRRRTSPEARSDIARTLDFLGLVMLDQGQLREAEAAYREALDIRRGLPAAQPRDLARTLNGLAAVLRTAGRFGEAQSLSREAVTIDEGRAAAGGPDLAESLEGLGLAAGALGHADSAARLLQRVLEVRRRALPDDHLHIASSLINLAAALGEAGQSRYADSLFGRGLELKRRLLGRDHPDVAADEVQYARFLQLVGRKGEAETLYRRALATARRRLPTPHQLAGAILLGLGELALERGDAQQAEQLLHEAVSSISTALPGAFGRIAEARQLLGVAILARGRVTEAERYLLQSTVDLRTRYGEIDRRSRLALERLARLYEASGDGRAAVYRAQLRALAPP